MKNSPFEEDPSKSHEDTTNLAGPLSQLQMSKRSSPTTWNFTSTALKLQCSSQHCLAEVLTDPQSMKIVDKEPSILDSLKAMDEALIGWSCLSFFVRELTDSHCAKLSSWLPLFVWTRLLNTLDRLGLVRWCFDLATWSSSVVEVSQTKTQIEVWSSKIFVTRYCDISTRMSKVSDQWCPPFRFELPDRVRARGRWGQLCHLGVRTVRLHAHFRHTRQGTLLGKTSQIQISREWQVCSFLSSQKERVELVFPTTCRNYVFVRCRFFFSVQVLSGPQQTSSREGQKFGQVQPLCFFRKGNWRKRRWERFWRYVLVSFSWSWEAMKKSRS